MRRPGAGVMSRPGADTRCWLTFGVVVDLGYDPVAVSGLTGGVFADVQFQPSGEIETCYVGMPYAGGSFGAWWPLRKDDTVLVAIPMGDSSYGPVIISRFWNSGDLPPSGTDLDWAPGGDEPPTDAVIRMQPGAAYKLRGSGANIDIRVEGTGDVIIENLGAGKVKLGLADTSQPVALAPLVEAAIKAAVEAAIAGHVHTIALNAAAVALPVAPVPTLVGVSAPPAVPYVATVATTAATKTEAT